MIPTNDRDLKLAAMAIILYTAISENGEAPEVDDEGFIEAGAYLDDEALELTLQQLSEMSIDDCEMYEEPEDDS